MVHAALTTFAQGHVAETRVAHRTPSCLTCLYFQYTFKYNRMLTWCAFCERNWQVEYVFIGEKKEQMPLGSFSNRHVGGFVFRLVNVGALGFGLRSMSGVIQTSRLFLSFHKDGEVNKNTRRAAGRKNTTTDHTRGYMSLDSR